ncbi:DMT family transporter [Mesorhizobium sp. BAC0120]|uniref:DMT family transporter n=1 Tax=Mesorhizobium sp. BAC0120 TaxID=3090670 RepID=UPI00298C90B2|nr:DMT family transporter [Mesorhizobium sp. BAC0120]MDW6026120.1 DMT family transporter [Mesorhizobium sp. BAC0120]
MSSATRLVPPLFVLLWATGFIGARYAMPWAEPFTFLAGRFLIAFVMLAAVLIVRGARKTSLANALHATLAGLLMHGVYLGGVFWAIHRGMPAGISALIVGLQPLITAVMAGQILGEKILPKHWLGLGLGFVGVVIVLSPKFGAAGAGITLATLAASVIAVVGMSLGTIIQKRFGNGTDPVTSALYQYLGASVLMTAGSLAVETRQVTINGELLFAMAWLVLVLSIGAIFLLMYMIREGEMSKVASLFYLVPAVTAVIAWALFGESLSLVQVAGMALTTFGVGLATRKGSRAVGQ